MKRSHDGFLSDTRFKLVSVGRITEQKGFDIAIDAAKILKDKGLIFCWYIIGDGPLKKKLENEVKKQKITNQIKFIGIRTNPYSYINKADIYVMPSRFEGKSIALDEAKILCKAIVVTKYPSVFDAIQDKVNGYLVDINAESIAAGIFTLYNNLSLRKKLQDNLKSEDNNNENSVIHKFLELIK